MYLNKQNQAVLIGDVSDWSYVPMTKLISQKVNEITKKSEVQREFHLATRAYEAIQRWDIFRHFKKTIPKARQPEEGSEFLKPWVWDGSDWRCMWKNDQPGRRPAWFDYCCARACHWMTVPWLLVVTALFPDDDWQVLSSPNHTGIVCFEKKLIFDPYFYAVGVPIPECISLWTKCEDWEYDFCEIHDAENPYSHQSESGTAVFAQRFWELADSWPGSEEELTLVLKNFIDNYDNDCDFIEDTVLLTESDHLNQDPLALEVLATRQLAFT